MRGHEELLMEGDANLNSKCYWWSSHISLVLIMSLQTQLSTASTCNSEAEGSLQLLYKLCLLKWQARVPENFWEQPLTDDQWKLVNKYSRNLISQAEELRGLLYIISPSSPEGLRSHTLKKKKLACLSAFTSLPLISPFLLSYQYLMKSSCKWTTCTKNPCLVVCIWAISTKIVLQFQNNMGKVQTEAGPTVSWLRLKYRNEWEKNYSCSHNSQDYRPS